MIHKNAVGKIDPHRLTPVRGPSTELDPPVEGHSKCSDDCVDNKSSYDWSDSDNRSFNINCINL